MGKNWPMVPLGEILTKSEEWIKVEPDKQYKQVTVKLWGQGIVLRNIVFGNEIAATKRLCARADQFIVSRIDARNGAFGLIPDSLDKAIVSNDFPSFILNTARIVPKYLAWLSKTRGFIDLCNAASEGTTNRIRLKEERFLSIEITLPTLGEQQRIVARIEELADKLEESQRLRQQSINEAELLFNKAIQTIFLKGIEEGWPKGRLGDYVTSDCYGTSEKTNDDISGTPILGMKHIQNGRLEIRDLKYLHLDDRARAKLTLKKGDILVNRTNSAELVGKCAVFDIEGDYAFASYLIRLRLDTPKADPRLVAIYINSPLGREYMFNERKQMTGQANVNATKLKALPIALPSKPEQRRIVAYLDELQAKVDALKKIQAEAQKELDALLPSILNKAFSGEL